MEEDLIYDLLDPETFDSGAEFIHMLEHLSSIFQSILDNSIYYFPLDYEFDNHEAIIEAIDQINNDLIPQVANFYQDANNPFFYTHGLSGSALIFKLKAIAYASKQAAVFTPPQFIEATSRQRLIHRLEKSAVLEAINVPLDSMISALSLASVAAGAPIPGENISEIKKVIEFFLKL